MKSIQQLQNLQNKKVLVRVDFNVPIGKDGVVDEEEDWKIKATKPTIEYLLKQNAKIILISHLGRPEISQKSINSAPLIRGVGGFKSIKPKVHKAKSLEYSLRPIARRLEELLKCKIKFVDDCIGDTVKKTTKEMKSGEIILLENLRFYKEEEENNEKFAKELAGSADIYVNDGFSVSHRAHASVSAITRFLPSYAGLLLEREVKILSEAINNPKRPATVIIGGAKVETKVPVIEYLMDKFDYILVGGVVANVILKAKGIDTGKSLSGGMDLTEVQKIDLASKKLYIPVDVVVCNDKKKIISLSAIGKIGDNKILDIAAETANLYSKIISDSKTVLWNGPMGMFEDENYAFGTKEIAKAVAKSRGYKIIGGGDTISALDKFGYLDKMDYVCAGGGAMLEFLSGNELPGIKALG